MIDSHEGTRRMVLAGRAATEVLVARCLVRVLDGPDEGAICAMRASGLLIGTSPEADLVLTDPGCSRRHALVTLTPEGVRVEDLGSTNGTWVSGARLDAALVRDGTELRVGDTLLRVGTEDQKLVVMPEPGETGFMGMVSDSDAMRDVWALIRQLARADLPVTITGETGTGKELVARALHEAGPRKDQPFRVLDCGAVQPELLSAQLFGHERGAFTGADKARPGILREAGAGTVFLDEVGELELAVQPNLLRALETREVTPLGGTAAIPVKMRVVSATHRDLAACSQEGRFRADLFYRLACVTIHLPALRERAEDVPLLAAHFARACAARNGVAVPEFDAPAMARLRSHGWPGNVRELRNVVDALTVLAPGAKVNAEAVARHLGDAPTASLAAGAPETLEEAERQVILRALEATGWNRKAAARKLGISPTTIFKKIKDYGLVPPGD